MVFDQAYIETHKTQLERLISKRDYATTDERFKWDTYIAKSQLQKAIRRGETNFAIQAGTFLLQSNERSFWRRLVISAVEDIGVANLDLIAQVCIAAGDKRLRHRLGGSERVATTLTRELCASRKDRSTDDLHEIIVRSRRTHTCLENLRKMPRKERINIAINCVEANEFFRATNCTGKIKLNNANNCTDHAYIRMLAALTLAETFDDLSDYQPRYSEWRYLLDETLHSGIARCTKEVALLALKRSGSVLAIVLPFLQALTDPTPPAKKDDFPPETNIDGLPSWVLNGHTRVGLSAFRMYLARSARMKTFIRTHADGRLPPVRIIAALVFHLESGVLNKRLQRPEGLQLRRDAEAIGWGLPDEVVGEARHILASEFGLLNACRTEALEHYLR